MTSIIAKLLDCPVRIYVAAAGAGAGIQEILWRVSGASRFFEGATFPYGPEKMERFLGYRPDKFVCQETAIDMAISAYLQADNGDPNIAPIGLGLTASVATLKQHRGEHRICAAVITRGGAWYSETVLDKTRPDARVGDGMCADADGLMLILKAAGIDPQLPQWAGGTQIMDITEEARRAFMARPLFTRAVTRLPKLEEKSPVLYPGSFNPAHDGHFHCGDEYTIFQITSNAPHKPPLSLSDMLDRLHWLHGKRDVLFLDQGATYLEKSRLFPGSTIIMGSDSLKILLDPKWGHEIQPMLEEMSQLCMGFLVNERGTDNVREILQGVPDQYRYMFSVMPPSPYRDLSSTQIRESRNRAV